MIRRLDDALLESRAGAGEVAHELLSFDELVVAEVEDRKADGARVSLELGGGSAELAVLGDRLALRRAIGNVIDNAVKYGGFARLKLIRAGPEAVLLQWSHVRSTGSIKNAAGSHR